MATVDVRIERLDSSDQMYLHNGMWGPATPGQLFLGARPGLQSD